MALSMLATPDHYARAPAIIEFKFDHNPELSFDWVLFKSYSGFLQWRIVLHVFLQSILDLDRCP